jgi:hypothetical protein
MLMAGVRVDVDGHDVTRHVVGMQLTFDGREIPIDSTGGRTRSLTLTQRRVLQYLDRHEFIRPREAGLLHYEAIGDAWPGQDEYAAQSGWGVLDRLLKRGLVRRAERGIYVSCFERVS